MYKCLLFLLLCVAPTHASATPTAEAVLEAQRVRGYTSASDAIDALMHVGDASGTPASGLQSAEYYAELARLAVDAGRPDVLARAQAGLAAVAANQPCAACELHLLLSEARAEARNGSAEEAAGMLGGARPLLARVGPRHQLAFAYLEAFTSNARGNFATAIEQGMAALETAEALGNVADQVRLTLLLVGPSADLGHLDNAEAMADEVIGMASDTGYVEAVALAHLNKGYLYGRSGRRDRQLESLRQALALSRGIAGLARVEAIARANLSDYYLHLPDYPAALQHANRARLLAQQLDDRTAEAIALANAGIARAGMGRPEDGLSSLQESMAIAEELGEDLLKVDIARETVTVLQDAGRYREALQLLQEAFSLTATITRQERNRQITELQARYETERKEREIERLSTRNRLRDAELQARQSRQQLWAVASVALALLVLMLGRWLIKSQGMSRRLRRQNASLAEQSTRDPLTGAFNRRFLERRAGELEARGIGFGLLVLDIDHFKLINDSHGHDAGDVVLAEVARRLRELVREQDAVVRWGGEEFVILLPEASDQGLPVLCRRVLERIGADAMTVVDAPGRVTVSCGATVHDVVEGSGWEHALRIADTAMYLAKQGGRNRAVCVLDVDVPGLAEPTPASLVAAEQAGTLSLAYVEGPAMGASAGA